MQATEVKPFSSPPLVKVDKDFRISDSGDFFMCCKYLEELVHVPEAETYWIEASTRQWIDQNGYEVWVRRHATGNWTWGITRKKTYRLLSWLVSDMLNKMSLAQDRPVRIFYRLVYLG